MPDFSWQTLIFAILGSIGGIGGIVTAATFITTRLDKRRERLQAARQIDVSNSVDLRRVRLEEDKFDEGIWETVARERLDIIHAHEEKEKAVRAVFRELDLLLVNFRVAKVPDEVVDLLVEKAARLRAKITEGRDALS